MDPFESDEPDTSYALWLAIAATIGFVVFWSLLFLSGYNSGDEMPSPAPPTPHGLVSDW